MPETRAGRVTRTAVRARARALCEYCRSQERFATHAFSVEHILPLQAGGTYSCQGCNNHKYVKTDGLDPVSGDLTPLFHPRRQRWQDHFIWSHDFTRIRG